MNKVYLYLFQIVINILLLSNINRLNILIPNKYLKKHYDPYQMIELPFYKLQSLHD